MEIIVPTDFSENAMHAAVYAVRFARQCKASLHFLHVLPVVGPTLGRVPTVSMREEMEEEAAASFSEMLRRLDLSDISYHTSLIHDSTVAETLEEMTAKRNGDLVIMGTKGVSGIQKVLLGSNAVDAINQCCTPVLAVPPGAQVSAINKLLYASNLINATAEIDQLLPLARTLGAGIKILHMHQQADVTPKVKEEVLEGLRARSGGTAIEMGFVAGADMVQALETYQHVHPAELLVMFTHQTNFLKRLFTPGLVREIAWHGRIPVLVIKNH